MPPLPPGPDRQAFEQRLDALLDLAEAGGPDALKAARQAAAMADGRDVTRVSRALAALTKLDPADSNAQIAAARLLAEQGDLASARAAAETALKSAPVSAVRGRAAELIGDLAIAQGDNAAARRAFTEALRIASDALNAAPSDTAATRAFARAKGRLADLDVAEGRDGRGNAEAALALLRAIAQGQETPDLAADIADAQLRLGPARSAPRRRR